jgi:hypothetical protein
LVRALGLCERPYAELGDVLAVAQQGIARQESFQDPLVLEQRSFPYVLTAHEQGVEDHIKEPFFRLERVLQELEA